MDILIIGGTGVLSFAIVNESLKQGHHVTCINRGKLKSQILPKEVELLIADYHEKRCVEELIGARHFDVAIDCLCYDAKDTEYSVALLKDRCDQYMFISSCAVYKNDGITPMVCDEEAPKVTPIWEYSVQKVACEKRLIELSKLFGFKYTIIRPAVTYGNTRIPYGITPPYGCHGTLIQRLLRGKPIILWNNGEDLCNITRVEDFAIGVVGLYGAEKAMNEAFNVVGDEAYTWRQVINTTAEILGVTPKLVNLTSTQFAYETPNRKGEIIGGRTGRNKVSNVKLKSVVPLFKTNISLKEGITKTIRYYLDNGYVSGIDYSFDGDWDRIATKYDKAYRPQFIDYLGNASTADCRKYHKALTKSIVVAHIKLKIHSVLSWGKRIVKKCLFVR